MMTGAHAAEEVSAHPFGRIPGKRCGFHRRELRGSKPDFPRMLLCLPCRIG
jgi:hypothetical protein